MLLSLVIHIYLAWTACKVHYKTSTLSKRMQYLTPQKQIVPILRKAVYHSLTHMCQTVSAVAWLFMLLLKSFLLKMIVDG